MNDREKTSISFSVSLAREVKKRGIDLDLDFSSAVDAACRLWLTLPPPPLNLPLPVALPSQGQENLINSLQLLASYSAQISKTAADLVSNIEGGSGDAAAIATSVLTSAHATADRVDKAFGGGQGSPGETEGSGIPPADGDRAGKPGKPKRRS